MTVQYLSLFVKCNKISYGLGISCRITTMTTFLWHTSEEVEFHLDIECSLCIYCGPITVGDEELPTKSAQFAYGHLACARNKTFRRVVAYVEKLELDWEKRAAVLLGHITGMREYVKRH